MVGETKLAPVRIDGGGGQQRGGEGTSGTARGTATRKDGNNKEDSEDGEDNRGDNGDDIGDGDKDNSLRTIFPVARPPRFFPCMRRLFFIHYFDRHTEGGAERGTE